MDKHELAISRGDEAARILNSPLWVAAFTDTRQALLNGLASLDNLRDEHAQDLHAMVKALDKVQRCLTEHVTSGQIAAKDIEARKKSFLRRA
jgi:hypothetical protein